MNEAATSRALLGDTDALETHPGREAEDEVGELPIAAQVDSMTVGVRSWPSLACFKRMTWVAVAG